MANAVVGRVLLISKGDYSASATYKMLDWVRHDGKAWVCKQTCVGQIPQAGDYWQLMASDGTDGGCCYIRYSANSDGTGFVANPTGSTIYIGFYTGDSDTAPTSKADYTWSRYVGAKGDTGAQGIQGIQGIQGVKGDSGNLNYYGTLITGNSTTPTAYATGITMARVNDSYTNTTTFFEYRCTVEGNATTAKWVYVGSKKGADGLGSGDMLKATYDVNNNGIVDNAEKLGGKLPSHYLYSLPIGGSSLGGVKNGGNVNIDAEGNMNADVGAGTWDEVTGKPFTSVGTDYLKVTSGILDGDSTKLAALNVASADRLKIINVTTSGAANTGKWTKVGSVTINNTYTGYSAVLMVTDLGEHTCNFFITFAFRTLAQIGVLDMNRLFIQSFSNSYAVTASTKAIAMPPCFKLVYDAPLVELWFNPTQTYASPTISILNENSETTSNLMTYYSNQPYQDDAPTGTVLACTPLPVTADQLPTASSSAKGAVKISGTDGLTMDSDTLKANVKGLINNKTDFDAQTESTEQAVDSNVMKEILDDMNGIALIGTLAIAATSITFTDDMIVTGNTIKCDYYTDVYGVSPSAVTITTGSMTLTFSAQTVAVGVRVEIREVE